MRIKVTGHKAQSTIEYIAVIIVIIGVFIFAGVYYQRSLQGKYRHKRNSDDEQREKQGRADFLAGGDDGLGAGVDC